MPLPYRPPLEEDMAFDPGYDLKQLTAESRNFYNANDIARDTPQAIPGMYVGQALQDVAKLGYFHGPKPIKKLSQKLSALAFGPDKAFNDETTLPPSLRQYKGLHEGVKRGVNERLSNGMIDYLAPRLAKPQNADVGQVRDNLTETRDYARDSYQPSFTERLQEFGDLAGGDLRQAKIDHASLKQAGLGFPRQQTPSGNTWGVTNPVQAQKLLSEQLKYLGMATPSPAPSDLRLLPR